MQVLKFITLPLVLIASAASLSTSHAAPPATADVTITNGALGYPDNISPQLVALSYVQGTGVTPTTKGSSAGVLNRFTTSKSVSGDSYAEVRNPQSTVVTIPAAPLAIENVYLWADADGGSTGYAKAKIDISGYGTTVKAEAIDQDHDVNTTASDHKTYAFSIVGDVPALYVYSAAGSFTCTANR